MLWAATDSLFASFCCGRVGPSLLCLAHTVTIVGLLLELLEHLLGLCRPSQRRCMTRLFFLRCDVLRCLDRAFGFCSILPLISPLGNVVTLDVNCQRPDLFHSLTNAGQTVSFLVVLPRSAPDGVGVVLLKVCMAALRKKTPRSSHCFQSHEPARASGSLIDLLHTHAPHVERHRCSVRQLLFGLYHRACLVPVGVQVCSQGTCVLAERGV